MYDAMIASLDHLKTHGSQSKKVLLLVTDGDDNSSVANLDKVVRTIQESEILLYVVALNSGERIPHRRVPVRQEMESLTGASGGTALFPNSTKDLEVMASQIAAEIRNQYVLSYVPSKTSGYGRFRKIRVVAEVRSQEKLVARTRTGYYFGGKAGAAAPNR